MKLASTPSVMLAASAAMRDHRWRRGKDVDGDVARQRRAGVAAVGGSGMGVADTRRARGHTGDRDRHAALPARRRDGDRARHGGDGGITARQVQHHVAGRLAGKPDRIVHRLARHDIDPRRWDQESGAGLGHAHGDVRTEVTPA